MYGILQLKRLKERIRSNLHRSFLEIGDSSVAFICLIGPRMLDLIYPASEPVGTRTLMVRASPYFDSIVLRA